MKIVQKARGQGKTKKIIEEAANDFAYIVCIDKKEARRVAQKASKMGLDIPFPLTFDEVIHSRLGGGVKKLIVDNIDLYIEDFIIRAMSSLKSSLKNGKSDCFIGFSYTQDEFGIIDKFFKPHKKPKIEEELSDHININL